MSEQSEPSAPARRVLVVDNSPDLARALGELIRADKGLEFIGHVSTGAAALQRAQEQAADVLVVDLSLDDCTGFDVLQRIRADALKVKVVMFSGHASPELAARARQEGAAAYIVKDGSFRTLLEAIRAA